MFLWFAEVDCYIFLGCCEECSLVVTDLLWYFVGKLADCSHAKGINTEIFIVEGDSAGGSAKQARDRLFQAILPLRGKILNTERCSDESLYKNKEITSLIVALGLDTMGSEDLSNLRYDKIVILTDADVDGAHIRTLLLTFLFR